MTPKCPDIILVPGFMSPAWMMFPLARYLRQTYPTVLCWDYPRVFCDLDQNVFSLRAEVERCVASQVVLVSHSFGDWIARSALSIGSSKVRKLISICPVNSAVPVVQWLSPLVARLAPELRVMSDPDRAAITFGKDASIQRRIIWARWEWWLPPPLDEANQEITARVRATHNSILFQPNGWRAVLNAIVGDDDLEGAVVNRVGK